MIFSLSTIHDDELQSFFDQCIEELSDFFNIHWVNHRPGLYVVKDRKTATAWWRSKEPVDTWGWLQSGDVYVWDVADLRARGKEIDIDYYHRIVKHELVHIYVTQYLKFYNNMDVSPDWLWEGLAVYLSGMNYAEYSKPDKFCEFLKFDFKDMNSGRVYWESGFAIEFLHKNYGKGKLMKLIKLLSQKYDEKKFAKDFKKIYGFELNYENFNK
jgi:hypothetical protein